MTKRRTWTTDELIYLRENYHAMGAGAIAVKLARTEPAVRGMASKLGMLPKKPAPTYRWRKTAFKHRCQTCGKNYTGRAKSCPVCRKKAAANG